MAPKKKGKGNKLAKMSDEERMRYLQHLADIEEEARRRKEELIARYMKNKLNKEEVFARINLAKINLNWRLILRRLKIKDMEKEVQIMITTFTWMMDSKNAVISRLMTSLEEAEDQYSRMLQAHMEMISHFLGISGERLKFFHDNFEQQKDALIEQSDNELHLIEQSQKEAEYSLQLVIHQQEEKMKDHMGKSSLVKAHLANSTKIMLEEDMNNMVLPKQLQLESIWNDMKSVFTDFVNYHDPKIQQYQLLRQKDALFRKEINQHMEQFLVVTDMITHYQYQLENLTENFQFTTRNTRERRDNINMLYTKIKLNITEQQESDKNQLEILSVESYNSIKKLEDMFCKVQKIVQMDLNCRKYEMEGEKVVPWNKLELSKHNVQNGLSEDIMGDIEALDMLENFWFKINRVTVHAATLKAECDSLKQENKHLKNCLKNFLMEAALGDVKGSSTEVAGRPASMRMYRITQHASGTCEPIVRRPVTCVEGSICNAIQHEKRLNKWKNENRQAQKIVVRRYCW
ncbi:dynein regulatory complex subunit 2 [Arctopsyche grandis]|uniref:dynein regulatory complex subunit 2 n=1 Tax=Arctopsyche grandis TaxID=121162 RepID=UPI00406D9D5C